MNNLFPFRLGADLRQCVCIWPSPSDAKCSIPKFRTEIGLSLSIFSDNI